MSFINYKDKDGEIFQTLDKLAKKGVKMKALCRVDIVGKDNIEKLKEYHKEYYAVFFEDPDKIKLEVTYVPNRK